MAGAINEQAILDRLVQWGEANRAVDAMILYSSRANPAAQLDMFSDYDILLAVTDVRSFYSDDRWLSDLGDVLVVFRNPVDMDFQTGFESFTFVTHYADGIKIDFAFVQTQYLASLAGAPSLSVDLDNGYMVLLDKSDLTADLPPPTHTAYRLVPPEQNEYRELIEEFFNDSIYVAKNLWRDNLLPVKHSLDHIMKHRCLRKMLEWSIGVEHHWTVKLAAPGKGLKQHLPAETWSELERTYVGAGTEENWQALFSTIELFRRTAVQVGGALGYEYPFDLDARVTAYLLKIKRLDIPGGGGRSD
jgi:aminoglycoside 6-adenylyltransferase